MWNAVSCFRASLTLILFFILNDARVRAIPTDDFVVGECTLNDAGVRAIPTDDFVEGECVLYGLNIILYKTLANNETQQYAVQVLHFKTMAFRRDSSQVEFESSVGEARRKKNAISAISKCHLRSFMSVPTLGGTFS